MSKTALVIAFFVAPVLALGGGSVALAASADNFEQHRIAADAYETAWDDATSAHDEALDTQFRVDSLSSHAKDAMADATAIAASTPGYLDAAAVAKLAALVEAVKQSIPADDAHVPGRPTHVATSDLTALARATADAAAWAGGIRSSWEGGAATIQKLDGAVRELDAGMLAVAASVKANGDAVLGSTGSASAATRTLVADAMHHAADRVEAGGSPAIEIAAFVAAGVQAKSEQADADAAAAAAAAAASGAGGGSGGSRPNPALGLAFPQTDPNNPPIVYAGGAATYCSGGYSDDSFVTGLSNGQEYSFYSDRPYEPMLFDGGFTWIFRADYCA